VKPTRDILTVTEMKTKAPRLLARLNEERRPVLITQDGKPRAVMLDVESYEELQASLGMLKLIAQSQDDFKKGRSHRHEDVVRDLRRSLKGRGRRQA
jgi:prevent-host-death family protein